MAGRTVKYDPCMKRMKLSHIMRKYFVTCDEAVLLRGGEDLNREDLLLKDFDPHKKTDKFPVIEPKRRLKPRKKEEVSLKEDTNNEPNTLHKESN